MSCGGKKVLVCLLVGMCDKKSNPSIGVFLGSSSERCSSLLSILTSYMYIFAVQWDVWFSVCILMRR